MVWFFLAGFIAGVVGTIKFSRWMMERDDQDEIR